MTVALVVMTICLFLVMRDAAIIFRNLEYPNVTTATCIAVLLALSFLAESVLRLVLFGE